MNNWLSSAAHDSLVSERETAMMILSGYHKITLCSFKKKVSKKRTFLSCFRWSYFVSYYYGLWTPKVMVYVKNSFMMDLFFTNTQLLASQDINWWTGVVWIIVMFLSAVWTHSDGTHSLQRIHWWASDAMLHFSKYNEETNSSYIGWPSGDPRLLGALRITM